MQRGFRFYCNLTSEVIEAGARTPMPSLLLSIAIAKDSPKLRAAASKIVGRGRCLMADNGNASALFGFIGTFQAEAARLDAKWRKAKDAAASAGLRREYREFASVVRNACVAAIADTDVPRMLAAQTALAPSEFVCHEDYTLPVLLALGVDPERLALPKAWYVGQQLLGIEFAARTAQGRYGSYKGKPYATLHAVDYDTAYDVGYYAGLERGTDAIATGMAGHMNDQRFITSYVLREKRIDLSGSTPRRYLRALQVCVGLRDGYRDAAGRAPSFHALGLGSPIMLPLLALALGDVPALSVDSTAPIKNANMGKLMLDDPAYMNGTIEGIANDVLAKGYQWTHRCVFCRDFLKRHPFRYDEARRYHRKTLGGRSVRKDDLAKKDGIGRFMPLLYDLSALGGTPLRKELHLARVGHNHAVIGRLTAALDERRGSKNALRQYALGVCEDYRKVAAQTYPPYARQIDECLRFIALAKGDVRARQAAKPAPIAPAGRAEIAKLPAAAVIGLEKAAIVAAVGALSLRSGGPRAGLAALSVAAWRAMRAASAAADAAIPEAFEPRAAAANAFAPLDHAIVAARGYADAAEPLAMDGAFLATPGGDKGEASVRYRKEAAKATEAMASLRERLRDLAAALDGNAANVAVDRAAWETRQKEFAAGKVPGWLKDALVAEGCGKDASKAYQEWFARYYRKRVKPQKLSYLFRIAYYELRKAEARAGPT